MYFSTRTLPAPLSIVLTLPFSSHPQILATVPDLITVLDARTGLAIGVPEYRYGLRVEVLAIAAPDKWTSSRGLAIAGPEKFGYGDSTSIPGETQTLMFLAG